MEMQTVSAPLPRDAASTHPVVAERPQTFRSFVTGPCNALAYNSIVEIARAPRAAHPTLYIEDAGSDGKTHLLHALAGYLRSHPASVGGREVVYVTGDEFCRERAEHARRHYLPVLRRRYQRAGALLLDDIAPLCGDLPASDDMVAIIDFLRAARWPVVIAERVRPRALAPLSDRLALRLQRAAIATIKPADAMTRLALLHQEAARLGVAVVAASYGHVPPGEAMAGAGASASGGVAGSVVTEAALALVAQRARGSVGDLLAAFQAVVQAARQRAVPATETLTRTVLAERAHAQRQAGLSASCRHLRAEQAIAAVAQHYGLPRAVLLSKSREWPVAQARQALMYLLREDCGLTCMQVAHYVKRDHSTAMHGVRRIQAALDEGDELMACIIDNIRGDLARRMIPRVVA